MGKIMDIPWAKPNINKDELAAVKKCFDSGWLSMGRKVTELENLSERIVQSPYAIAVNAGTAALDIALKLIRIKPGDEVIIPALAYIATGNAVLYQGATPVFADIDPVTYTLSPESMEKKITRRTKAVIVIDYAGQAADYNSLRRILKKKNIPLIEDGAPGLGGFYHKKPLCAIGDIGITSFHIAKVFTTIEGGMVFTRSKKMAELAKKIRSQGESPEKKYHHPVLGHNYRMSDIHAAIGLVQLSRFRKILELRKKIASRYNDGLSSLSQLKLPQVKSGNVHSWFLYPVLTEKRDKLAARLKLKGIGTNISWPMPIYEQKMFRKFFTQDCPVAKNFTKKVLCLPIYVQLTKEEQDYVIKNIKKELDRL